MDQIIQVSNVSKEFKVLNRRKGFKGSVLDLFSHDYRIVKAVNNLKFSIGEGEIVAFIGPNGAGKSTIIKMMTGVLMPSSGQVRVDGENPYKNRIQYVRNIGVVLGQRTQLWWDLPVWESFSLLKEIYGITTEEFEYNMKRFETLVNLQDLYKQQVRNLSLGQRMLCDIAASFLHNPKIIFLDEPTIGLDVSIKNKIRRLIRDLNKEKKTTIVLTSHDIGDIDALCERIIMIDKGNLIFDGSMAAFKKQFGCLRTLNILIDEKNKKQSEECLKELNKNCSLSSVSYKNENPMWCSIVIDENKESLSNVLSFVMNKITVKDIKVEETSTESVIEKMYLHNL